MRPRPFLLRLVARCTTLVGFALAVAGCFGMFWDLRGDLSPDPFLAALACAAAIGFGLLLMAAGESVRLLFAIEENLRRATNAVQGSDKDRLET